jgi:hypothetical protein
MSKDSLAELRRKNAYYCRDPEKFLAHVADSESRKKFFFQEELGSGKLRLWMVLEGISPIVLSYIDFEKPGDLHKWIEEKIKDFVEFAPLSVAFRELATE